MQTELVETEAEPFLFLTRTCKMQDVPQTMAGGFGTLEAFFKKTGVVPVGPPLAIYSDWQGGEVTFRLGFPVSPADAEKARGEIAAGQTPAVKALKGLHRGSYAGLGQTHMAMWGIMKEKALGEPKLSWERYVADPESVPEAELITEIYMALPE